MDFKQFPQTDRWEILELDSTSSRMSAVYLVDPATGDPIVSAPGGPGGVTPLDPRLDNLLPIKIATESSGTKLSDLLVQLVSVAALIDQLIPTPGATNPTTDLLNSILTLLNDRVPVPTPTTPDPRLDDILPVKIAAELSGLKLTEILALLLARLPEPAVPISPPVRSLTRLDSGNLAVNAPIAFKVADRGQIMRSRVVSSLNSDCFAQFVYATNATEAIASQAIHSDHSVPAKAIVSLEDYSDSFNFTQQFWVRFSSSHRTYSPIPIGTDEFITGEVVTVY